MIKRLKKIVLMLGLSCALPASYLIFFYLAFISFHTLANDVPKGGTINLQRFAALGQVDAAAQLTGFSIAGTAERSRLILEVKGVVVPAGFLSSAPYRYAIDLPQTNAVLQEHTAAGEPGFLKTIRYGRNEEGILRVIIGADDPFILNQSFVVPASDDQTSLLVYDFEKTSQSRFNIEITKQAEQDRLYKIQQETRAYTEKAHGDAVQAELNPRFRIVVDPGHGGKDGGARARNGVMEKDIVLSFAERLAEALRANGQFDVVLTRTSDRFVSLSERVRIARDNDADLFISIHADSLPQDHRVRGSAVYTISNRASDRMAAELAAQQNQSDAIVGYEIQDAPNDVVDILFDLTRRETSNLSRVFAQHFLNEMQGKIRFFKIPLQRAAFTVLRVPDIPSALIELGFLSNNADADLLASSKWRERVALDMAAAIRAYFKVPLSGITK